jgi:hypothetical protein
MLRSFVNSDLGGNQEQKLRCEGNRKMSEI